MVSKSQKDKQSNSVSTLAVISHLSLNRYFHLPQRWQSRLYCPRPQPCLSYSNKVYQYLTLLYLWQSGYWANQFPIYSNLQNDHRWADKSSHPRKVPHICQINEHGLEERVIRTKSSEKRTPREKVSYKL